MANIAGVPKGSTVDDKENFPFPSKAIILKGRCVCSFKECRAIQQEFTNRLNANQPELRGGQCFSLDLSGESEKDVSYRNSVLSHIGCGRTDLPLTKVLVARHHWSLAALDFFGATRSAHQLLSMFPFSARHRLLLTDLLPFTLAEKNVFSSSQHVPQGTAASVRYSCSGELCNL
jgi:hypothetical protein